MSEESEVLKEVCRRLESTGISYMITGSTAANFYAVPRMTRDIDIVIEICKGDAGRLIGLFKDDFYIDQESVSEAVEDQGMFNILHNEYVIKIDFIVRKEAPYRRLEFERRRPAEFEGQKIWIVSPEDLILSKLFWAKDSFSENDTSLRTAAKMREMFHQKLPEERLHMGCSMYDFSKQLVTNAILRENPKFSKGALRLELFRRFYGNDFDVIDQQKIENHLAQL